MKIADLPFFSRLSHQLFPQKSSLSYSEAKGHEKLLVVFGGIYGLPGMPVFEFKQILKDLNIDIIFLRDLEQVWYFKGLRPFAKSMNSNVEFLESITKRYSKKNIIFLGNSAGGFASLLYGAILGVGKVVAFSPQTFLDTHKRRKFNESRWENNIKKLHDIISAEERKYLDLSSLLFPPNTEIQIHIASNCTEDLLHVKNLVVQRNINIVKHKDNSHLLIKNLRDNGELYDIIKKVIQ